MDGEIVEELHGAVHPSAVRNLIHEARLTLLLALPMMAGQVSQMLMGVTDTVMVGQIGVVPLASAAFASNVLSVLFIIGVGLQVPVSILAAQAHGAGERRRAGEILRHGLVIGLGSGLAIAGSVTAASFFLQHLGQEPAVAEGAKTFLRVVAWSLLPLMLELNLQEFCQALGRPWVPMCITMSAVLANVFLNWVLIYGHFGAPALGLAGSGLATLFCRLLSAALLAAVVLRGAFWKDALPARWLLPLDPRQIGQMLRLGFPISITLLMEVAAFGVAALMMGWIGAGTLAAHQIAINCAALTFMVPLGLSFAVAIRMGHTLGAEDWPRLPVIGYSAMGLAALVMGTSALVFLLGGEWIAGFFVKDQAVIALAGSLLGVAGVFQLFDGWQVVGTGALRGLSDVKIPTLSAFCAYWLVALPLAYWLAFVQKMGGLGVWWALAAGLASAAFFAVGRFYFLTSRATSPLLRGTALLSFLSLLSLLSFSFPASAQSPAGNSTKELIPWLLKNDANLTEIPFSDVIQATSGKRVLAVDRQKDAAALHQIGLALDAVLARMNGADSPVKNVGRINEVSHFFEDALLAELNRQPGCHCTIPLTASGREQRSGYPDLQLVLEDGRTFYLDPKLFARGSRDSSFRTFYFEPRSDSNKVNRDAVHLIVGIEHDFAATGRFLNWELIDLSDFKVRLKAEFEGSNRDLYRDSAIVGSGAAK